MLTQTVRKYIEEHKLCSDYLFSDWSPFLDLLYSQGGRVEAILWFEHVRISEQKHSLGFGGYKDKTNPSYMYAETDLYEKDLENKSLSEVKKYIQSVITVYPNNELIPSFYIAE